MNVGLFKHFERGWKVYVADEAPLLKIYDGRKWSYFAAFGPPSGDSTPVRHIALELSAAEAEAHSFSLLVFNGPKSSDRCTLVLVELVEGDIIETETLELIEMHAGTCIVDSPFRGHD